MNNQIEIYQTGTGTEITVQLSNQTVWLDAHAIAALFDVQRPAIVKHIQNIYKTAELFEESTCSVLEQVAGDGKKRKMNLYNLDMIISVGYRVNSQKATRFRIWATQRLKDYLVAGYAVNQKRLEERDLELKYLKTGIRLKPWETRTNLPDCWKSFRRGSSCSTTMTMKPLMPKAEPAGAPCLSAKTNTSP